MLKDSQLKPLFVLLGSEGVKAAHKHVDEIDPRRACAHMHTSDGSSSGGVVGAGGGGFQLSDWTFENFFMLQFEFASFWLVYFVVRTSSRCLFEFFQHFKIANCKRCKNNEYLHNLK